ncbi:MAG: hypothetical protein M1514_02255 [Patescibacteria group bacterium]|nr:hypothetical protein [Patescibacteria group bacterium]
MEETNITGRQNIALLQQWLLEQGRCLCCGQPLVTNGQVEGEGVIITCPCQEKYFYLPKINIYKRLIKPNDAA